MEAVAEHALQVLILLLLLGFAVLMQFTRAGTEAQFFVLFAVVGFAVPTAVGTGGTLLVVSFLSPRAVVVDGFAGLLWLVVLASLISTVIFDLGAEGLLLRFLQRLGLSMNRIRLVEAIVGSFFIAAALYATALFLPNVRLSIGAAVAAGAIASFVRYFIGLYLGGNVLGDDHVFDKEDRSW